MSSIRFRYINLSMAFLFLTIMAILVAGRKALLINVRNYPFDDGLFIGRAESLIAGTERTLGSTRGFNPLVKGQIYPFALEVSNQLNLNPLILVYSIFLILIILLSTLFFGVLKDKLVIVSSFVFIVLDPSPFSAQASRISREFIYEIILLMLFITFISLKLKFSREITYLMTFIYGILIGSFVFLANNTREEKLWIYVVCMTGIVWIVSGNRKRFISLMIIIVISIFTYYIFDISLRSYNKSIFGVNLTSTTLDGEFPRLMSNLSTIKVKEEFDPYVSISESKRNVAYEVSPSFGLLKEYLEGDGKAWIQFGCQNTQTCDDYANGWFHVALRVAIDDSGLWVSQKQAQDYMRLINNELEFACSSGEIECMRALPLAKALGVTQITIKQIRSSIIYFKLYIKNSIFGWNQSSEEHVAYTVMEEKQWERWGFVIKSLPESQIEYQNSYNHRISLFNPIYEKWAFIYKIISFAGILSFFFVLYNLISNRKRFSQAELLLASIAFFSLFVWLSRGLLLALNSATNFISISENYALPGRVFLPLALSIFFYLGVIIILKVKNAK